jgi:NAD(P)H-dependent flavin oxidoreductase YrpB (nitropropane dioxygenase family)
MPGALLTTELTRKWGLEVPIVGAPMSPMAGGRLAAAISIADGLGMIGVSSTPSVEQLERAKKAEHYGTALVYAGQSVGMVERVETAAAIVRRIVEDAEAHLRRVAELVR